MNIVCAIGAPWGREAATRAVRLGFPLPYVVGDRAKLTHAVERSGTRAVFCLNWSHRVPDWLLDRVPFINFHCTDLRNGYGRGGHPIENLILRGHTETVISAHQMTSEIDAGPIYGVSESISLAGTKADIQQRFIEPVSDLMLQIVRGELQPKPQDGEPVYFKRLPQEELEAFWASREKAA